MTFIIKRWKKQIFWRKSGAKISKVGKTVKAGFYHSEYFHSKVSDFILVNTTNLEDYKRLIELLRDSKIYSEPYFEIIDIIVGQENLFEDFNEKFKKEK